MVRRLLPLFFVLSGAALAARVQPVPVPPEMRADDFIVTVNGKPVEVARAAASYDFASFDGRGTVEIAVTAKEPGFWNRGVDIQPWRLGLRARRDGQTIRFPLAVPAKLAISRPRDFLNHAHMLFLFAGTPPPPAPRGARVYAPGVYHESLNPRNGETIYLAPGAYLFGSLNLWKVSGVKVLGRGTIVYDGPQNPGEDEGWMPRPDWHCIGTMDAHNVEVDGLTCVVRSRTWSVQVENSSGFVFDDLRVIGGNPGNANQDGIDWIGSSGGLVKNSFLRASDDDLALMGNWDGYTDADMLRPGRDVKNIVVESSELSTSISNIVRAGWPRKIFNSANFTLRDSDVLHAGIGACGLPFGLLGMWSADGARGDHAHYTFENLFLDDWYSLVQMEQEQPAIHDFTFRNIWALDQPPLVPSLMKGQIAGVVFDNLKYGQRRVTSTSALPVAVANGAAPPAFPAPRGPVAAFTVTPAVLTPGDRATFTAAAAPHAQYTWLFGDGETAHGRKVTHRFADAAGTQLDGANGAGRFRVLLHVETRGKAPQQDWAAQGVVVVARWQEAKKKPAPLAAGIEWRLYPGTWSALPDLARQAALFAGTAAGFTLDTHGFTRFAAAWDGFLDVPADGGYTFHLLARDGARVAIDGVEVARTGPPFSQVCSVPGNAMRYERGALGLRKGLHTLHVEGLRAVSDGLPRLLWEGPGVPLADVPGAALKRLNRSGVTAQTPPGAELDHSAHAESAPGGFPVASSAP